MLFEVCNPAEVCARCLTRLATFAAVTKQVADLIGDIPSRDIDLEVFVILVVYTSLERARNALSRVWRNTDIADTAQVPYSVIDRFAVNVLYAFLCATSVLSSFVSRSPRLQER